MKYDFPGIKKYGTQGLELALGSTTWGAALLKLPIIGGFVSGLLGLLVNWLANNGLMLLDLGAIAVEGEWDQHAFDQAMDDAFNQIKDHTGELTPAQKAEIDNAVIQAARRFIVIGRSY